MALEIAKIIPLIIPAREIGRMTFTTVCHLVAPRAKDAFTKCKRDRNYRRTASDYLKPDNFDYYTKHCN